MTFDNEDRSMEHINPDEDGRGSSRSDWLKSYGRQWLAPAVIIMSAALVYAVLGGRPQVQPNLTHHFNPTITRGISSYDRSQKWLTLLRNELERQGDARVRERKSRAENGSGGDYVIATARYKVQQDMTGFRLNVEADSGYEIYGISLRIRNIDGLDWWQPLLITRKNHRSIFILFPDMNKGDEFYFIMRLENTAGEILPGHELEELIKWTRKE